MVQTNQPSERQQQYAQVPQELRDCPQWVAYKSEPSQKTPGRTDKRPIDPKSGRYASSTDSQTWSTYPDAVAACSRWSWNCHGIGFVFTEADPYVGIDLDHCIEEDGVIAAWAQAIIDQLASYTEKSPSGQGIHILCRGTLPDGGRKKDSLEMYCTGRFLTVTGDHIPGTPLTIEERSAELATLHARCFPSPVEATPATNQNQAVVAIPLVADLAPLDYKDKAVLAKARKARNSDVFIALYDKGDSSNYPSESEADQALCALLAYWTDKNPQQMDRLFRHSALYRLKWDEKRNGDQTYGQMTIARAMQDRSTWVSPQSAYSGQRRSL